MFNARTILLSFLSFLLTVSFLVSPANAQEVKSGLDLTINPAIIELATEPGTSLQQKFRIRNNLSRPIKLKVSVDKLSGDINGQVLPVKPEPGETSTTWVTFDKSTFTALPKEWTDVAITIKIPSDAAFGYYYALRISQSPDDVKEKSNNTLLGEIAIPVLMTIQKPGAERNAQLVSFKTEHFINEYIPVNFVSTVQNNGNIHVRPRGNIFIRGSSDVDLGILDVNAELGNILPGSSREYKSKWADGFLEQSADKKIIVNWDKITKIRIGKYTANMILVYDNGKRDVPIEATTTFWVFPYRIIGLAVLILVGGFLSSRYLLKLYIKKQVEKYHHHK